MMRDGAIVHMSSAVELLGGEAVLGSNAATDLDLAKATREGFPVRAFDALASAFPDTRPLSAMIAAVGSRSCAAPDRNRVRTRLTPAESDAVFRIANALAKAIRVLGDQTKAAHWLTAANTALGGETPISLLDTSAGTLEVNALLDRIEYGVYS